MVQVILNRTSRYIFLVPASTRTWTAQSRMNAPPLTCNTWPVI